jgi:FkbM family methyltransferase
MLRDVEDGAKAFFRKLNVRVTSYTRFDRLKSYEKDHNDIDFLKALPEASVSKAVSLLDRSKSQLRQDLFVLSELGFKRDGFFVEFGATDGNELSNSWILEKDFGWKGILAEPARVWHQNLKANRGCIIETDCVWKVTGDQIEFAEIGAAALSTVASLTDQDSHHTRRRRSTRYQVTTVTLTDMLARNDAPAVIDYLSIDTEGSEYDILAAHDFDRFKFSVITCEHNFTPNREKIFKLLTSKGYRRVMERQSQFDDWYVLD